MLSWLKLLIKLLQLLLVGCLYYCINGARSHKHQIPVRVVRILQWCVWGVLSVGILSHVTGWLELDASGQVCGPVFDSRMSNDDPCWWTTPLSQKFGQHSPSDSPRYPRWNKISDMLMSNPKKWIWHSEDRVSWNILIIKPTRRTNISNLFWIRTLHFFGQFLCPSSGV